MLWEVCFFFTKNVSYLYLFKLADVTAYDLNNGRFFHQEWCYMYENDKATGVGPYIWQYNVYLQHKVPILLDVNDRTPCSFDENTWILLKWLSVSTSLNYIEIKIYTYSIKHIQIQWKTALIRQFIKQLRLRRNMRFTDKKIN